MPDIITLQTPRLTLHSVTPALIHELFNTKSKEEICAYFAADEAGYEHVKNMHEKGMETNRLSLFYFLLHDKESGKVIGDCGYHTWNATHRRAELFYNMKDESFRQKGLMAEAVTSVLKYGFEEMGLHRVEALTAEWNHASKAVLKKFGFTFEGTMREDYCVDGKNEDSICFSLLKHEWISTQ